MNKIDDNFDFSSIGLIDFQDKVTRMDYLYYEKYKKYPRAKTVTFQITENCNLACTYCYQINKSKKAMSFETAKKFIDLMIKESYIKGSQMDMEEYPYIIIEFIGGEPLLEIDLMSQITEYLKVELIKRNHPWAVKHVISFISNGTLYFEPKFQEYVKKNIERLSFSISIDGNKQLHDACRLFPDGKPSYDIAVSAAKHFMKNYGKMGSKMTIAPENVKYTYDAFKNLIDLGYDTIHGNCVYEEGWTVEHAKILYSELKKLADLIIDNDYYITRQFSIFSQRTGYELLRNDLQNYCGGTGAMIAVNPEGKIFTCIRFMKSSIGNNLKELPIGHVDTGIGVRKDDKKVIMTLNSVTRRTQSTDECFDCPIAAGCGWCSGYNYQTFKNVDKRATFICEMHKARILANVYYWNSIYKKNNMKKRYEMNVPEEWALNIINKDEYDMLCNLAQ